MPRRTKVPLSYSRLRELLIYNQTTGEFHWLVDRAYGKIKAGEMAGNVAFMGRNRDVPRRRISIDLEDYFDNQLAWFYMTEDWPQQEVDHINRDTLDCSWSNLRMVTSSQNNHNRRPFKRKSDLPPGVYRTMKNGKHVGTYYATKMFDRKSRYLGSFSTVEEASFAYENEKR